jgi:hypothetical protein
MVLNAEKINDINEFAVISRAYSANYSINHAMLRETESIPWIFDNL